MQSYWELNQQIGTLLPSLSHNQLGIQIHPNANVQGRFLKLYILLKAESVYFKNFTPRIVKVLEVFSSDKISTTSFLHFLRIFH